MTAPSPALIPIDPKALEVALAMVHSAPDVPLPDILETAIRAYLAASPLPAVVEAATNVVFGSAIVMAGDGFSNSSVVPKARLTELDAALAALKGGNDAG